MSFRNRLTVFFIVLVILPMIVVAAVGFVLASDSEQGKTDARLSEAQTSASGLVRAKQDEAEKAARVIAGDKQLAQAIQAGQRGPIQARLNQLASDNGIRRGVMALQKAGRFETRRGGRRGVREGGAFGAGPGRRPAPRPPPPARRAGRHRGRADALRGRRGG